ncbi:hypothetical protein C2E23DRAFT_152498 [Lenzites betulinus]|nr:hypothetical protein C2E23DRAFT_152498 [Lenzites betulinus]
MSEYMQCAPPPVSDLPSLGSLLLTFLSGVRSGSSVCTSAFVYLALHMKTLVYLTTLTKSRDLTRVCLRAGKADPSVFTSFPYDAPQRPLKVKQNMAQRCYSVVVLVGQGFLLLFQGTFSYYLALQRARLTSLM